MRCWLARNQTISIPGLLALVACVGSQRIPLEQVEMMRTAANVHGTVVDVYPLSDAEASQQLEAIVRLEQAGKARQALTLAEEASRALPRDPLIWQYVAELALQTGSFARSLSAAARAASLGPARGALCVRSWQTMVLANRSLGKDGAAQEAAANVEDCTLRPEPRL